MAGNAKTVLQNANWKIFRRHKNCLRRNRQNLEWRGKFLGHSLVVYYSGRNRFDFPDYSYLAQNQKKKEETKARENYYSLIINN